MTSKPPPVAASGSNSPGLFPPTRWSVVLAAAGGPSTAAQEAVETLYRTYRPVIYQFLRRFGYNHHDAEDLAQALFARLLAREWLKGTSNNPVFISLTWLAISEAAR